MIERSIYIRQIADFIDKPFVKVLTGIRRSGKSTVMQMICQQLQRRGVDPNRVLYINMESFANASLNNATSFYQYLSANLIRGNRCYVLIDEIQEVKEWEKLINSIAVDFDVDIYITGSNAQLLSSELATYLAGRYIELHIYPLSFEEVLYFKKEQGLIVSDRYTEFEYYLRMGGFPVLHTADYSIDSAYKIIYDIYSSVILRDTLQRNNIRDIELLERIVRFVFDNIGNRFSGKNVADYFKSQQRKLDINTVYNYLKALESAFIIHRVSRFDVKGKEILKTQEKFYAADSGLLYSVMGLKDRMIAGIMENIVFLELKRKGYDVFVGKMDQLEIDFVATKGNQTIYIQVCYLLAEESTIKREFLPLMQIKDNFPKYVVTMDQRWKDQIEGIRHIHIADFLLEKDF